MFDGLAEVSYLHQDRAPQNRDRRQSRHRERHQIDQADGVYNFSPCPKSLQHVSTIHDRVELQDADRLPSAFKSSSKIECLVSAKSTMSQTRGTQKQNEPDACGGFSTGPQGFEMQDLCMPDLSSMKKLVLVWAFAFFS